MGFEDEVEQAAHRVLTDAQNFGDAFLARPTLAQCINLAARGR